MSGEFPLSGTFAAPVYVVTASAGGERNGCVVGFASEVSIDPPRFMACISRANATFPVAMRAQRLAVHALSTTQRDLAALFGGETGDDVDKFAHCDWEPAEDGTPILARAQPGSSAPSSSASISATTSAVCSHPSAATAAGGSTS